jgi:hypothetical protein
MLSSGQMRGYDALSGHSSQKVLTAQYCRNGHPNGFANPEPPAVREKFCKTCGTENLAGCPQCQAVFPVFGYVPPAPAYCHGCGKPLPWTQARLEAARDLVAESVLNDDDKRTLNESVDDLVRETPRTPVAVSRFKTLAAKAGVACFEGLKKILMDVLSEAVRKQLWPGG